MKFEELPFAIILEICGYLDSEALTALADVNKEFRNLSLSYKSYWLPSDDFILPVAHKSIMTFSPKELSIATRKALFRERNLALEHPTLYSSNRILWPHPQLNAASKDIPNGLPSLVADELEDRRPLETCWIPSLHDNGDWCFALSKDFILRALHLRTGALVLEETLYHYPGEDKSLSPAEYSFDSVDDFQARISVITPCDEKDQEPNKEPFLSVLTTYTIHLDPKNVTASLLALARTPMRILPRHFDIAGNYVVIVEDTETEDQEWPGFGLLHLFDWRTGECMNLPPLLHSFGIAAFPDYFISLGTTPEGNIELQVVSLLPRLGVTREKESAGRSKTCKPEDPAFMLAGSIPIRPDSNDIQLQASDELAQICHRYTGRTLNTIRLWIRDDFIEGCYSVFSIPMDFRGNPENWFTPVQSPAADIDPDGEPEYAIECKRLTEKDDVGRYVIPGTFGKRFFWWKEDITPIANPTANEAFGKISSTIRLYSSTTDLLDPLPRRVTKANTGQNRSSSTEMDEEEGDLQRRLEACMSYPDQVMDCPYVCEMKDLVWEEDDVDLTAVYSIIVEDWSGTVLVILTTGDLLVLRFGHP